jgi:hypothetical protein
MAKSKLKFEIYKICQQAGLGFAILGQKQYPSALVRYWALARAEVFQSSFVLYLYICFSIGQRFRAEDFQIPQHRKALPLVASILQHPTKCKFQFAAICFSPQLRIWLINGINSFPVSVSEYSTLGGTSE